MAYRTENASKIDLEAAHRVYGGPFNAPLHSAKQEMSSWTAHILLVRAFQFSDADASELVNSLIKDAHMSYPVPVASAQFTTHQGKRTWIVLCKFAPFVQGSIFTIKEA